jgi:hypothetical protein
MPEINADKIKYKFMSRNKIAGRSHRIKVGNIRFGRLDDFKYMGTVLTNQNFIQEGIESSLNSVNACVIR